MFPRRSDAERVNALVDSYRGRPFDYSQCEALLRLILLHRYSDPKAQIATAPDFDTRAALV